jgi:hypothetical protein
MKLQEWTLILNLTNFPVFIDLYDGRTLRPETIDGSTQDPGTEKKNPHVS